MQEVRCAKHGVFDYRTAACPGCANDARRRYDELAKEDPVVYYRRRTRIFEEDEPPAPISEAALAVLRAEDASGAAIVKAQLDREVYEYREQEREKEQIADELRTLSAKESRQHRLVSPGDKYVGRLLGAVDIGLRRYARLEQQPIFGGDVLCVPWVDAFAEHVGQDIIVQWIGTKQDHVFRVSDRDGRIAGLSDA